MQRIAYKKDTFFFLASNENITAMFQEYCSNVSVFLKEVEAKQWHSGWIHGVV